MAKRIFSPAATALTVAAVAAAPILPGHASAEPLNEDADCVTVATGGHAEMAACDAASGGGLMRISADLFDIWWRGEAPDVPLGHQDTAPDREVPGRRLPGVAGPGVEPAPQRKPARLAPVDSPAEETSTEPTQELPVTGGSTATAFAVGTAALLTGALVLLAVRGRRRLLRGAAYW